MMGRMSKPVLTHKPAPAPTVETRPVALPEDWDLPAAIRSRLGERLGKQRAMFADGHLLLILHRAPSTDHATREAAAFWRDPQGQWRVTGPGEGATRLRTLFDEYE